MGTLTSRARALGWRAYWPVEHALLPGMKGASGEYEEVVSARLPHEGSWLDLGCGWHTFPLWREDAERRAVAAVRRAVGVDVDVPAMARHRTLRHRAAANATALPFPDGTFDLVTAAMVVEHLESPPDAFREVRRVLRPGGVFVFHTPNRLGYQIRLGRALPQPLKTALVHLVEGRGAEDVYPALYRANDRASIEGAAEAAGLEVVEIRMVLTHAEFAALLPVAVLELLWLRALALPRLAHLRPNIVAALSRPRVAASRHPENRTHEAAAPAEAREGRPRSAKPLAEGGWGGVPLAPREGVGTS